MRFAVLDTGRRIDGRDLKTVRPIVAEVGILPRTHGSALFTRGETQALVVTTLGTSEDEQFVDSLEGTGKQNFMLHYNFPPYSVGETGRMGAPGRREIGHGKLAWRAVHPMLPSKEQFPYTLRVVSEITESERLLVDGHRLQVYRLALMDAGAADHPSDRRHRDGSHQGRRKRFAVLSDILGDEDHLGDMDFKVAGTGIQGVTSSWADGTSRSAASPRRSCGLHIDQSPSWAHPAILGEMAIRSATPTARSELGEHAPRIEQIKIPTDKIRDVIGSGGKVIREIVEKTGAKINVEDDGTIKIASADGESIKAALKWISGIVAGSRKSAQTP